MAEALSILTAIGIILIGGLLTTLLSQRFKISNVLLLIILGIFLKYIQTRGAAIFEFSHTFLISISVLALVMITFDGCSRLTLREIQKFTGDSMKIVFWFVFLNLILLGTFTNLMFFPDISAKHIIFSLIFAVIMAGTDPGAVFSMMKDRMTRVIGVLEIESVINTPVIVIVPFILMDLMTGGNGHVVDSFIDQLVPFLRQIIVGIGAGVIVGIIIFKAMKKVYDYKLSPLGVITAALMAYVLAENLGGNGVLSVATMGLFFGNIYVKRKISLQEFSSIFSNALEILVFVLIGFLITFQFTPIFFIKSFMLFIILIISRWLSVTISLRKVDPPFTWKEKMFMSLNIPKGIAVAVVIFSLSISQVPEMSIIIDLILMFILYSLILSTIINRFSKKFIKIEVQEEIHA
ncbi:cation:proton antiporter [Bacteroidota bacterium]